MFEISKELQIVRVYLCARNRIKKKSAGYLYCFKWQQQQQHSAHYLIIWMHRNLRVLLYIACAVLLLLFAVWQRIITIEKTK